MSDLTAVRIAAAMFALIGGLSLGLSFAAPAGPSAMCFALASFGSFVVAGLILRLLHP
jgi:hypothetical protein